MSVATSCLSNEIISNLNPLEIRKFFPIFDNAPQIIYFDNASTTQKPASVLEAMNKYYTNSCANSGRASYHWATLASLQIEQSREAIANFINANPEDIVFTSGATESLNTVAFAWGLANLKNNDEIMLCDQDHKSATLPWYNIQKILSRQSINIAIKPFEIHTVGDYNLKSVKEAASNNTKLLAMSHVHHVYGLDMEVPEIRKIVGNDVVISLDASQSVGHCHINVKELDVDFISFSAHKMFAPNGLGILWINPRRKKEITAFKLGGRGSTSSNESASALLESGTLNIPAILGLKPAIELIESIGINNIHSHVGKLMKTLYIHLKELPGIDFAPGPGVCGCPDGSSIIAFRFEHISTSDLSFMLDGENIFIRSGDHCLTKPGEGDDYIRVSLHAYNTEAEINHLADVLAQNIA